MARKKVTSTDSSGNGSDTTVAASAGTTANELERLRDILIGNYVRSYEQSIGELQEQLGALRNELETRVEDIGTNLANDLQKSQESARQREEELTEELQQLRKQLDFETAARNQLGQMLVELGQYLQHTDSEPEES